jgi:hypothetical protein
LLLSSATAFAEDAIKPEQYKKMYEDALAQLKAAQDRKAELSKENEVLGGRLAELQKQLAATQDQVQGLKRQVADNDDRSFMLRAYQAAWNGFLRHHPDWLAQWKLYLGHSAVSIPGEYPDYLNMDWTFMLDELPSAASINGSDAQTAAWKQPRDSLEPLIAR